MKPILKNMNFNVNLATLVFSDGYAVTMTYNELQEIYKLLKDTFEEVKEQTNENGRWVIEIENCPLQEDNQ